ncbi:hypothetical protein LVD15_11410 [Fulvivirga maritima]|uniref:hypothetical protein n=1 Tax=Fulvivirga maritima TaxID=2904247 RepID=UPI001F43BF24|nr:hypothetical protein [Fulvivirga maritima]UII29003.1 hypothetical protein LVD15_11410 [Fulvivirga maritima]
MKSRWLVLLLLFISSKSISQSYTLTNTISINKPEAVSIDKPGNIYIADNNGDVKKYLTDGKLDASFSAQSQGQIDLIEAWNPLKIFLFYEDLQQYTFLDRFLTTPQNFSLNELSDFNSLATLSYDNNLWLIDLVDFSLKKYDLNIRQFTLSTPFDLLLNPDDYEITFIKEYQNLVFFSDIHSGIYVFDNLGNYLRKIQGENINYFNFSDNEVYFLDANGKVKFIDIYSLEERELNLKPTSAKYVLISESQLYFINEDNFEIYRKEGE